MGRRDFTQRGQKDYSLGNADADIMGVFDSIAKAKSIAIDSITIDPTLQVRVDGLNEGTVQNYMAVLENGETLPAIVVFRLPDGGLLLSSGFHRVEAHKRLGLVEIAAEIREGTRQDAIRFAFEDNKSHGLPLSNKDKKAYMLGRLEDGMWSQIGNREIARQLGISHVTVMRWIEEHNSTGTNVPVTRTQVVGSDGRTYNTERIRQANEERKAEIKPVSDEALKPRTEAQAKNLIAYLKQEIDNVLLLIEQQQRKAHPNTLYLQDLNKKLSVLQNRRNAIAETLPTQPDTVKQVTVDWSGETPAVREMTSGDKARGIINKMGGLLEELSDTLRRDGDEWTVEEWNNISAAFQTFLDRCQALVTEE